MTKQAQLLFVYNADSDLFNTLADAAHKILSPDTYRCNLCKVTHGWFTERTQWRDFVQSLDAECRFLHRDEFHQLFPSLRTTALPAVFRIDDGAPHVCLPATELNTCADLDALIGMIRRNCGVGTEHQPS